MRTFIKLAVMFILGWLVGTCTVRDEHYSPTAMTQPGPHAVLPQYQAALDATHRIDFKDGHCTGVQVGSRTVITAFHCFEESKLLGADGTLLAGEVVANDGNDHVILVFEKPLAGKVVQLAPMPPAGTQVYTWGNPGALEKQLRFGHVAGAWTSRDGSYNYTIDMNNWHGDSGGPIFDMQGRLVAIHTGYYYSGNSDTGTSFRMTVAEPIAFTPEQLALIK